jgi:hypothetical protein
VFCTPGTTRHIQHQYLTAFGDRFEHPFALFTYRPGNIGIPAPMARWDFDQTQGTFCRHSTGIFLISLNHPAWHAVSYRYQMDIHRLDCTGFCVMLGVMLDLKKMSAHFLNPNNSNATHPISHHNILIIKETKNIAPNF